MRPWFDHESHSYASEYPVPHVHSHDTVNKVINIVNRRRLFGRLPADTDYLYIPCRYQVLRLDQTVEWLPPPLLRLKILLLRRNKLPLRRAFLGIPQGPVTLWKTTLMILARSTSPRMSCPWHCRPTSSDRYVNSHRWV